MTLFLDTEFNGFGGALISIALVSDKGDAFYAVRQLPQSLHPWVAEHVVPFLNQQPESDDSLQTRLIEFLRAHENERMVGHWPEDFIHLLQLLSAGAGRAYPLTLNMQLVKASQLQSEVPHNALSDARALGLWFRTSGFDA